MRFVDTNVFLRVLGGGDPAHASACASLFQRVEQGEDEFLTCEAVVCEVVYVLSSRSVYRLEHDEIRSRFAPYLRLGGLRLPGKIDYLRALDLFVEYPTLDYEDAVCIAHMEHVGIEELLSYDDDFDRVTGLRRTEPEA